MKIIITGWAWFIGSNFLNKYVKKFPEITFINVDALTYAWKVENILPEVLSAENYNFAKCDIRDIEALRTIYEKFQPTDCMHFAAESHVDNSIRNPWLFLETNILWTNNLLTLHREYTMNRFHYVWTDEVYGELPLDDLSQLFTEETPLHPHSPYSVSKAWWDMLTHAYNRTYWVETVVTRCSNNYGPNQDTEKLIPRFISLLVKDESVPLYGDWLNVRDWLYVEDHCDALWQVFEKGISWEVYNIWWNNEHSNRYITDLLLESFWKGEESIDYVEDRLWHDRRYAIDNSKITRELWRSPVYTFEEWIKKTIEYYKNLLDD